METLFDFLHAAKIILARKSIYFPVFVGKQFLTASIFQKIGKRENICGNLQILIPFQQQFTYNLPMPQVTLYIYSPLVQQVLGYQVHQVVPTEKYQSHLLHPPIT